MSSTPPDVNDTPEPTLDDTNDAQEDRGRIGYGANERMSSWMLGAVLIAVVLAIGAWQWFSSNDDDSNATVKDYESPSIGKDAPEFTLTTFSGEEIALSDQRGKVVILNFWGSWCEPCKREMPAFQKYWESAPDDVLMMGVGGKQDTMERSQAFAETYAVTYPIGRDDGGEKVTTGVIAEAYQIFGYPSTFVINPNGVVSSVVLGEMDEDDLDHYVQKARDEVSANAAPMAIDSRRND